MAIKIPSAFTDDQAIGALVHSAYERMRSAAWDAQKAAERLCNEAGKDALTEIKKARKALDDAEREARAISDLNMQRPAK